MSDISPATQRFYDAVARHHRELSFVNYGFTDTPSSSASTDLDAYSRRLYDVLLSEVSDAKRLVEVGCGRGGGAALAIESGRVGRYIGIDLAVEQLKLGVQRAGAGAAFVGGDATRLPIATASVDAVISLEASHHFENRRQFYGEVARSLRRGGVFLLAGLWRSSDVESTDVWRACELTLAGQWDITANVVAALSATSRERQRLVESLQLPDEQTRILMSWMGVRGYYTYEALRSGAVVYLRYHLVRG